MPGAQGQGEQQSSPNCNVEDMSDYDILEAIDDNKNTRNKSKIVKTDIQKNTVLNIENENSSDDSQMNENEESD